MDPLSGLDVDAAASVASELLGLPPTDGSAPVLALSAEAAAAGAEEDDDEFGLASELGACLVAKATGDGTCEALSLLLDLHEHLRKCVPSPSFPTPLPEMTSLFCVERECLSF